MNENIKVYANDCMPDLIKQIYKWSEEGYESVEVSITDLLLMANHIVKRNPNIHHYAVQKCTTL